MAKQHILWTVLPYGRITDEQGRDTHRISIVVSPRLTPEAANQQKLEAFPDFLDWPAALGRRRLSLRINNQDVGLRLLSQPNSQLWQTLLTPTTPVAGFVYQDMSKVNLRSFAVRNVLGFMRRHYGQLAVDARKDHPTLLPWDNADSSLKGMLDDLGTRTITRDFGNESRTFVLPGFSRFLDRGNPESTDAYLDNTVFSGKSPYQGTSTGNKLDSNGLPLPESGFPLRVLPADWRNPSLPGPGANVMNQFNSADEYAFYQADRFYRRTTPTDKQRRMRRPSFDDIPEPPEAPEYDFHRIIASYADYPELMRRLGLVIDCAITDNRVLRQLVSSGGGQAVGQMQLLIDGSGAPGTTDGRPITAWYADQERFVTRERSHDHRRGLLRLEGADDGWGVADKDEPDSPFDVYQVDPDGAALKTVGFIVTSQNLLTRSLNSLQSDGEVTYTTGDRQPVAALRSGGIGVSRHGRAEQVAETAASATLKNAAIENNNADTVVLFAEDLLRGYRVDVAPVKDEMSPGHWMSLCAREGRYRVVANDQELPLPPDEGFVKGASTSKSPDDSANPDDHYLHESMFRWTGWSLCTPRPGLTLRAQQADDSQVQGEVPTTVTDEASDGNGIVAEFKALKGSLPRLRFGQRYRLRARVVDLAGNSLAVDDPSLGELEHATAAVGYWRFEPVDPPALVHRHRVSEGESLERMVIRSNYDLSSGEYLKSQPFKDAVQLPASADFEYLEQNERHVVPPKASQQQCEHHGLFDSFFANPTSIKQGYAIAAREAGTLYDPIPGAQIELVTPQALSTVATTTSVPPALPTPENPVGDRMAGGQYIVHREAQLETPYLPDDAAGGVAIYARPGHQIPGVSGPTVLGPGCMVLEDPDKRLVLVVGYDQPWPNNLGCRIVLQERDTEYDELPCSVNHKDAGMPKWDAETRELTLFIAKGEIVRLAYASFIHTKHLPSFGLLHWIKSGAKHDIMVMAQLGTHWMLSPYRKLTMVHATQQPVCLPELIKMSIHRPSGASYANLVCRTVVLHGPSTGKFEIEADWEEWIDDLEKDGPERISGHGQLGEIPLHENHINKFDLASAVKNAQVDPNRDRARADRHELGDSKFRLIRYRVRATTRFREYLPPSLYADTEQITRLGPIALGDHVLVADPTDAGATILVDPNGSEQNTRVLASEPPDDPRVLYVVPTFRWQQQEIAGGKQQQVIRYGNGLRVWIDRPWFSSGDGELLGVMLFGDNKPFKNMPDAMQPFVTQWGLDPLWETGSPKASIKVSDFPARVHDEPVALQEEPNEPPAHVVGHRVHWDEQRKLWYCDIELEPGRSYMPFIRLALVRYQPNALPNARISKVVLSEFVQVLPRRRAVYGRTGDSVDLTLFGTVPHAGPMKYTVDSDYLFVSFANGPFETGRNRVELVLQTRDKNIDSDLAWTDHSTLATSQTAEPGSSVFDGLPILDTGKFGVETTLQAADQARKVDLRSGASLMLDAAIELAPGARDQFELAEKMPDFLQFIDPQIWKTSAALPDTGDLPRRLMLREFERYYTDHTVPHQRDGTVFQRRVIEERLVYSTVFDLDS